ncbi:unnamed protein product [Pylaiella littoralis]
MGHRALGTSVGPGDARPVQDASAPPAAAPPVHPGDLVSTTKTMGPRRSIRPWGSQRTLHASPRPCRMRTSPRTS